MGRLRDNLNFLRNAGIVLDGYIPEQDVMCRAFEGKESDRHLDFVVSLVIIEINSSEGVIEIESASLKTVFTQDLSQRLIIDEHTFRQIAPRGGSRTLAVLPASLRH